MMLLLGKVPDRRTKFGGIQRFPEKVGKIRLLRCAVCGYSVRCHEVDHEQSCPARGDHGKHQRRDFGGYVKDLRVAAKSA
jgi:hypothetical protein